MPKTKISEYDATAANNTDVNSINIAEGCAPSGINNAIRQVMADLKDFQQGTKGDAFLGPVTPSTLTLTGLTANRILYTNGSKVVATSDNVQFDGTTVTINSLSTTTFSASGVATFGAGSAGAPGITFAGDTNTGIYSPAADTIAFTEGGVESMRIDSSGNLGIGGVSTGSRLYVSGTSTQAPAAFVTSALTGTTVRSNSVFRMQSEASGRDVYMQFSDNVANSTEIGMVSGSQYFCTGSAERMRITSAGNVGIATNNPSQILEVNGNILSNNSMLLSANGFVYSYNGGTSGQARSGVEFNGSNGHLAFYTTQTERGRINSSGNMLIGSSTPIYIECKLNAIAGSSGHALIAATGYANDLGNPPFFVSKTDNNSTTSQIFVKFVIGNGSFGNGQINGNGSSQVAFGSWSDSRLKQNIVELPSQLANITALRPVEFDYIESEGGGHQIGFIAQEIQEIYPDAVGKREDGMLTVTGWNKTEARLVKAIQEQQALIETLTTRLNALEGK